jgi:hypothetical protein
VRLASAVMQGGTCMRVGCLVCVCVDGDGWGWVGGWWHRKTPGGSASWHQPGARPRGCAQLSRVAAAQERPPHPRSRCTHAELEELGVDSVASGQRRRARLGQTVGDAQVGQACEAAEHLRNGAACHATVLGGQAEGGEGSQLRRGAAGGAIC